MQVFLGGVKKEKRVDSNKSIEQERAELDAFMAYLELPEGVDMQDLELANRPARQYLPSGARTDRGVLCLHGGGYRVGSLNAYNAFMSHLALACNTPVTGLDYRLAPEHTYPADLDDAVAAFAGLSGSIAPESLMIIGDSAGGGLSLACLLRLKEQKLPLPGCASLLSPFTDLTCSGDSLGDHRQEFKGGCEDLRRRVPNGYSGLVALVG